LIVRKVCKKKEIYYPPYYSQHIFTRWIRNEIYSHVMYTRISTNSLWAFKIA